MRLSLLPYRRKKLTQLSFRLRVTTSAPPKTAISLIPAVGVERQSIFKKIFSCKKK